MSLTIAIIGRPNVGKSTLFNRLVGKRLALVDDQPGVTRDRRFAEGRLGHLKFTVIDTAGLEEANDDSLEARMRRQTELAYDEADVIFFLIDARMGVTPLDEHFADWIRKKGDKPVLLLANKMEGQAQQAEYFEAFGLGLGEPLPVSSEHGLGMEHLIEGLQPFWDMAEAESRAEERRRKRREMKEADAARAEAGEDDEDEDHLIANLDEDDTSSIQLAIVGRPNVGKSTLLNRLVEDDRVLTGPEAGVTRDAITVDWEYDGRQIKLVDTAGMRRQKKIDERVEKLSVSDTLRVIRFAQVVLLVLDGTNTVDKQDLTIARRVIDEGRALVIAVNKWDAVKNKTEFMDYLYDRLEISLPQVRGIPVITFSAKNGRGLGKLMPTVIDIYKVWNSRISTSKLNRWLSAMTERHLPPVVDGRRIKLKFMTQAKTRPPSFYINCTQAKELPEAYARYLINGMREDFDVPGVPIRIYLRSAKNPFSDGKGSSKRG